MAGVNQQLINDTAGQRSCLRKNKINFNTIQGQGAPQRQQMIGMAFGMGVRLAQHRWIIATIFASEAITIFASTGHQYWYTAPTDQDNIFTGNRVLSLYAKGGFPDNVDTFDVDLGFNIKWIVATENPGSGGPQFVATTEDGSVYVASADTDSVQVQQLDRNVSPDRPPLAVTYRDETNTPVTDTVEIERSDVSMLSHPLPVFPGTGIFAYICTLGNINLYDSEGDKLIGQISNVNALQDARIIMAPSNVLDTSNPNSVLLAVYAGATDYNHCVLGDCLEGSTLLFIQVNQNDGGYSMTLRSRITLPSGDVFEGLSPMFIGKLNVSPSPTQATIRQATTISFARLFSTTFSFHLNRQWLLNRYNCGQLLNWGMDQGLRC